MEELIDHIQERIGKKFIISCVLTLLVLFVSSIVTVYHIENNDQYGKLINKAGYQRMLSQKIIKKIYDKDKKQTFKFYNTFIKNHNSLKYKTNKFKEKNKLESQFNKLKSSLTCFFTDCVFRIKESSNLADEYLKTQNNFVIYLEQEYEQQQIFFRNIIIGFSLLTAFIVLLGYFLLLKPTSKDLTNAPRQYKENQDNMKKMYNNAEIGRLSAHIFHEIKNSLFILKGFLKRVNIHNNDEKLDQFIKNSMEASERIETLTLSMNRVNHKSNKKTNIKIKDTLNSFHHTVYELAKKSGFDLLFELEEDFEVLANQNQLFQILLNLVKNSLDANEDNPVKWIKVKSLINDNKKQIVIQDSGNGIDKNTLKEIFKPYFTTKEIGKGTGLGMSISQEIMKSHGGDIKYQTIDGHTAFILEFNS